MMRGMPWQISVGMCPAAIKCTQMKDTCPLNKKSKTA